MSNDPIPLKPSTDRNSPSAQKQSRDSTEMDLWDLDTDDSLPAPEKTPSVQAPEDTLSPAKIASKPQKKKPTDKISDASRLPLTEPPKPPAEEPVANESADSKTNPETETGDEWNKIPSKNQSTSATRVRNSFLKSFTKTERIAISALFGTLILSAILSTIHFYSRVPTQSPISEKIDYPVSGKLIEIHSAATYWRKPITTGKNADVVRRDTELIPVISLKLHGKSCAVRVFFRNDEGLLVGDGITREVRGNAELQFPATAGLTDIGMHAAYRTGEQKPWTAEVFEGPSGTSDRTKFRKVLNAEISTNIR